jgi:hypothetical protein
MYPVHRLRSLLLLNLSAIRGDLDKEVMYTIEVAACIGVNIDMKAEQVRVVILGEGEKNFA